MRVLYEQLTLRFHPQTQDTVTLNLSFIIELNYNSSFYIEKLLPGCCFFIAIECLLKHCHDLAAVDVSGCSSITNVSLELLTRYCSLGDRPFLICTLGGNN